MGMAYLLVALLGAAIALFAIQNNSTVVIRFLAWQIEGALSLVILLSALVGRRPDGAAWCRPALEAALPDSPAREPSWPVFLHRAPHVPSVRTRR